ncbi:MAG: M48 family metallopeptidase [Candidatus Aegiribacteria sp.]|nr:M48 family metallopeptidase [Candidatus Aegiribacteria sp.]
MKKAKLPFQIEDFRFENDSLDEYGFSSVEDGIEEKQIEVRSRNLSHSVLIAPELFPEIAELIEDVRKKLIPDRTVEGYVFNSGEGQAYSFGEGKGGSVTLALSSGLIERFSASEIKFIVGHEISHTLFGHLRYPPPNPDGSPLENFNLLALSRAREISADRIGFISCGSTESSFRGMLKLASGLSDKYIRFDLTTYLDQARELLDMGGSKFQLLSTHPLITSRVRALLWFEMSDRYYKFTGKKGKAPLEWEKLEKKIQKELAAVGGFHLVKINEAAAFEAVLWGTLALFLADGMLNQQEQVLLQKTFGDNVASEAIEFARNSNSLDLETRLRKSIYSASCLPIEIRLNIFSDIARLSASAAKGKTEMELLARFSTELKLPEKTDETEI